MGRSKTRQKAIAKVQARDQGGLDQGDEEWSNAGNVMKAEPTFADGPTGYRV